MATISSATAGNNAASIINSSSSTPSTGGSSPTDAIDWNALIEVSVAARLYKADSIDLKVTKNEAKLAAYGQMQNLLKDITTATQALRVPPGVSGRSFDVFQSRAAYYSANGNVSVENTLSITAENGADVGIYNIEVKTLAKAHKIAGTSVPDKNAELGYEGVFEIGTGADDKAEITITETMSMLEVMGAINLESGKTGIKASIIQVAAEEFRLVMTTEETGKTITPTFKSGDNVLQSMGLIKVDGTIASEVQASSQAVIEIDGIDVTRSTNDITDIIPGVAIHLYQVTPPNTSVGVEIGTNLAKVKEAVINMANAFNAYRDFALEQQTQPNANNEETTVLFGDSTLRTATVAIGNALTGSLGDLALSHLGLSFDEPNHLILDEPTLDDALLSDVEGIQKLLGFSTTTSSNDLMVLQRGTKQPPDFKLDVTFADGKVTSAKIGGDGSMFTIDGTRIIGKEGTQYEDFIFVYGGTTDKSIDVSIGVGLAEQLYNVATNTGDTEDGIIATVMEGLEEANLDFEAKSADIRQQAEVYRANLTMLYSRYQAAISAAESSQNYLQNLMDTWNAPS